MADDSIDRLCKGLQEIHIRLGDYFATITNILAAFSFERSRLMTALALLSARDGWEETIIPKYILDMFPKVGEAFHSMEMSFTNLDDGSICIVLREKDENCD